MRSTDELLLRPAAPEDAGAIGAVYVAARNAAPMPAAAATDVGPRDLEDTWVATAGEQVVGFARLVNDWLDDLYVDPGHARQGVGTALLDTVKGLRPDGFCLWVYESNAPARTFYADRGLLELEEGVGGEAPDLRLAWPGRDPVEFLRRLVDEADADLGRLLQHRSTLTALIQGYKPVGGHAGRDEARERQIAVRMADHAPRLGAERLQRIVHAIITESLDAAQEAAQKTGRKPL